MFIQNLGSAGNDIHAIASMDIGSRAWSTQRVLLRTKGQGPKVWQNEKITEGHAEPIVAAIDAAMPGSEAAANQYAPRLLLGRFAKGVQQRPVMREEHYDDRSEFARQISAYSSPLFRSRRA